MSTSTSVPASPARTSPLALSGQVAFAVVAAVVFGVRVARTAAGDAVPDESATTAGVILGLLAVGLSLLGAALVHRGRAAAPPLALALLLELSVLDRFLSPPRLVTAIPLVFALALALVPASTWSRRGDRGVDTARTVAVVVARLLMVPVGFYYLMTGLVAPAPDLYGAYALFGVLLLATVLLARRRSWWTLAVPPLSAGLWLLMLWAGETYLDWQP